MPPAHYSKGFSLLEVLVAFSILSLSLGLILEIVARGNKTAMLSHTYAEAVNIAESKLGSISSIEMINNHFNSRGTELEQYEWELVVSPYNNLNDDSNRPYHLYKAQIKVHWSTGNSSHDLELTSLRLLPES